MSKNKNHSAGRQNKGFQGKNEAKKQPVTPSGKADAMDPGSQDSNLSTSGNENPPMISSVALPGQTPAVENASSNEAEANTLHQNENEAPRIEGDTPGEENAASEKRETRSKPNKNRIIWLIIIVCIIGIGGTFLWMTKIAPSAKEETEQVQKKSARKTMPTVKVDSLEDGLIVVHTATMIDTIKNYTGPMPLDVFIKDGNVTQIKALPIAETSTDSTSESDERVPVALPWLISIALAVILSICIILLLVKSLRDGIAERLGYAKRTEVEESIANIRHTIGADMDEQQFTQLGLEEKFAVLTSGISRLMADNAAELETEKAAKNAAQKAAEEQSSARTIFEAEANANKQCAEEATIRADKAERRVSAADKTTEELNQKITDLDQKIDDLNKENERLKDENKGLTDEVTNLNQYKDQHGKLSTDKEGLSKQLQDLQADRDKIKNERDNIQAKLNKLQNDHSNLEAELNNIKSQKDSLQREYDERRARFEEIEASDAGQLTATLEAKEEEIRELTESKQNALKEKAEEINALTKAKEKAEKDKAETESQLETARQTIDDKQNELDKELKTSKELRENVADRDKEIKLLKSQAEKDANEIERQKEELENRQTIINNKSDEIKKLEEDNRALYSAKENLELTVSGLENDNASLTEANQAAKRELSEKADFIRSERNEFANTMMSLAKALSDAAGKDFLGCCDDGFESNRVSLQEKVAKPIRAFEREMAEIDPGKYASRDELADAYHALVKAQFDEASGLTRIAQWYAYSQVAFMADEDRSDGLFIRQQEINDIYDLAVKLMGNVGIAYSLPALYAERFPENGKYEDVTGQRQLNIEYMCPTARNHKENIDSTDTSQVIIDVVEVGYTDNKGNHKKSQVII